MAAGEGGAVLNAHGWGWKGDGWCGAGIVSSGVRGVDGDV